MESIFSKLQRQAERAGIVPRTKASQDWFIRKLRNMSIPQKRLLNDDHLKMRNKPLVGRMFVFAYDPKTKEKLPYYDRFPLILMVGPAKGGFYGLNLHYLSPRKRALFFDKLMAYATNKKYNQNTRVKLSYELLVSTSRLSEFAPCFKRYLTNHIKSPVMEILAPEWETALFLPCEKFVGATTNKVWKKSNTYI